VNLAPSLLGTPGAQQRRAMAKAITLLESTRADHRGQADALLTELLPHTGKSFRLGISGVPGVGKSTFIETLGLALIAQGHRVAVLAIDPSSSVSGGSILGDKTRMELLSVNDAAYIRPSPASGTLGGVAEKTREAMLVCEAAGYDVVIVETVGVGQSETAVASMTDMFVLLQLPNAGDDLQAIKKGVMELADLIVINKADIDADAATRAQAQITSALRLFSQHGRRADPHPSPRPRAGEGERQPGPQSAEGPAESEPIFASTGARHSLSRPAGEGWGEGAAWHRKVMQLSALGGDGVARFWSEVQHFRSSQTANGGFESRRQHQSLAWMWERIEAGLKHEFHSHPAVRDLLPAIKAEVEAQRLPASTAARRLLQAWRG
jgi:LAO/AO transport system kinase